MSSALEDCIMKEAKSKKKEFYYYWKSDKVSESRSVVSDFLRPHGLCSSWNFPGQNTGVGGLSLLQGIFPTQGSNPGLPHCGWILYQRSHRGSPRILEWVAYLFSSGSSWPRNRARLSPTLQADSLPAKLPGKPYYYWILLKKLCQDNSFIQLTTTVT